MKIISIVSSGRKKGNTERIVSHMEEELLHIAAKKNIQVDFEQIHLADSDIRICKGCRICFYKGEALCPLKDELLNIRDKIGGADGIILASPVYVEDVNGIMKNWIDRMAFNCHRPAFSGKAAVVITTSGAGSSNHALKTMKFALSSWGFYISAQGKFRAGASIEDKQINCDYESKIRTIVKKLFDDINDGIAVTPAFYSLMIFKVQQKYWQKEKNQCNIFDFSYWKSKGWLEKNCNYYIAHNSNTIKVKLAGIAGSIVSKFFI